MKIFNLSKIYQPKIIIPYGKKRAPHVTSISQKLLEQFGLVSQCSQGTYMLTPIALIVIKKLRRILEEELHTIGAQQVLFPSLIPEEYLRITGRSDLPELFKVRDRHGKLLVLGPTHEEAFVHHVAAIRPTYKQLPLLLYQISPKFRDEIKPRFGLIRSREFLMKDLYCFSPSVEAAANVYDLVNNCYRNIFNRLELHYCRVSGCSGEIGGTSSHEFHVITDVGEDKLAICTECGNGKNIETEEKLAPSDIKCDACHGYVAIHNGIEVGHSFLLGTRYTKPLDCRYIAHDHKSVLAEMSCHGIGLSRLLAAAVEALSTQEAIKWPRSIAPFAVMFIPPKAGSKEECTAQKNIDDIARICDCEILIDDRTELTIGKRLSEAKAMGYLFIIVFGKSIMLCPSKVEFHDTQNNTCNLIATSDLPLILRSKLSW